ncbi:unnamed protein product [Linum tenue]|uniref:DUF4283 domain-containing protein n=1 Tax=Linum tenue TaxID=586396 RepID=A0AAV0LLS8_9ROSI|nr:unnamed protein product [Linum tenue]
MQIVDLEQGYFMIKFSNVADYTKSLTEGPWIIFEHYLVVRKWTPTFRITAKLPPSLIVWVCFLAMPIQYYHTSILTAIGNTIGKLINIDYHTQSAQRGKFARIAVEIDVSKPLIPDFYLDDCIQLVEYENLPKVCFSCGRIGHEKEEYHDGTPVHSTTSSIIATQLPTAEQHTHTPFTVSSSSPSHQQQLNVPDPTAQQSETAPIDSGFGPWMIVKRKPRRSSKNKDPTSTGGMTATRVQLASSADKLKRKESTHVVINPTADQAQRRDKGSNINSPLSLPRSASNAQTGATSHDDSSRPHAPSQAANPRPSTDLNSRGKNHVENGSSSSLVLHEKEADVSHLSSAKDKVFPFTLPLEKGLLGPHPTATKAHEFNLNPPKTTQEISHPQISGLPPNHHTTNTSPSLLVSDKAPPTTTISCPNGTIIHVVAVEPIESEIAKKPSINARSNGKKNEEGKHRIEKQGIPISRSLKPKMGSSAPKRQKSKDKKQGVPITLQEMVILNANFNTPSCPRSGLPETSVLDDTSPDASMRMEVVAGVERTSTNNPIVSPEQMNIPSRDNKEDRPSTTTHVAAPSPT